MDLPDHRPALFQAQDWIHSLLAQVQPEHFDLPTPCDDWWSARTETR